MSQAVSQLLDDQKVELYRANTWGWITKQVKTEDEHDRENAIKPFPVDKLYLRAVFEIWRDHLWNLIEKSRQVLISWLMLALHLHLCQFTPFRKVFLLSKNETDSVKMVRRAWNIYERQEPWLKQRFPARLNVDPPQIEWENGSIFLALPKGVDQARQYTCSALIVEEAAFQERLLDICTGAWPALFGGGRLTMISSAKASEFGGMVSDVKRSALLHRELIPGIEFWKGQPEKLTLDDGQEIESEDPLNVIRVHYSADTNPSTQRKILQAKAGFVRTGEPGRFRQEYEIDYTAMSGERVWPQMTRERHGISAELIPISWPRYRTIDHGYRNPTAVLWAAVSPPGWRGCKDEFGRELPVIVIYQEYYARGKDVETIAREIHTRSQGETYVATLIDPSTKIHRGNENAGHSVFQTFNSLGIYVIEANNTVVAGLGEVRRRLATYGTSPALLLVNGCENTFRECMGYRYRELTAEQKSRQNTPEEPEKKDDHCPDALRYLCMYNPMPESVPPKEPGRGTVGHLLRQMEREDQKPQATGYSYKPLIRRVMSR